MDYYLLREERNDPDPRVENFIPDTWQVMKHKPFVCKDTGNDFFFLCFRIHVILLLAKNSVSLK